MCCISSVMLVGGGRRWPFPASLRCCAADELVQNIWNHSWSCAAMLQVSTFRNRTLRMPDDCDLKGEIKAKYEDGVSRRSRH